MPLIAVSAYSTVRFPSRFVLRTRIMWLNSCFSLTNEGSGSLVALTASASPPLSRSVDVCLLHPPIHNHQGMKIHSSFQKNNWQAFRAAFKGSKKTEAWTEVSHPLVALALDRKRKHSIKEEASDNILMFMAMFLMSVGNDGLKFLSHVHCCCRLLAQPASSYEHSNRQFSLRDSAR